MFHCYLNLMPLLSIPTNLSNSGEEGWSQSCGLVDRAGQAGNTVVVSTGEGVKVHVGEAVGSYFWPRCGSSVEGLHLDHASLKGV